MPDSTLMKIVAEIVGYTYNPRYDLGPHTLIPEPPQPGSDYTPEFSWEYTDSIYSRRSEKKSYHLATHPNLHLEVDQYKRGSVNTRWWAHEENTNVEERLERHVTRSAKHSHSSKDRPHWQQTRDWLPVDPFTQTKKEPLHGKKGLFDPKFLGLVAEDPQEALKSHALCGDDAELRDELGQLFVRVRYKMMRAALSQWNYQVSRQLASAYSESPILEHKRLYRALKKSMGIESYWIYGAPPFPILHRRFLRRMGSLDKDLNELFVRPVLYGRGAVEQLASPALRDKLRAHIPKVALEETQKPLDDGRIDLPPLNLERVEHREDWAAAPQCSDQPDVFGSAFCWDEEKNLHFPWFFTAMSDLRHAETAAELRDGKLNNFNPIHLFDTCEADMIGREYPSWLFAGESGFFYQQFQQLMLYGSLLMVRMMAEQDYINAPEVIFGGLESDPRSNMASWQIRAKNYAEYVVEPRFIESLFAKTLLCDEKGGDYVEESTQKAYRWRRGRLSYQHKDRHRGEWLSYVRRTRARLLEERNDHFRHFLRLFTVMHRLADAASMMICMQGLLDGPRDGVWEKPGEASPSTLFLRDSLVKSLKKYTDFSKTMQVVSFDEWRPTWPQAQNGRHKRE